jgi:pyruvate dehydrogenase E1 component alpha subunit
MLPTAVPRSLLDADGTPHHQPDAEMPPDDVLLSMYRLMVQGRSFDTQATALVKQGRLAVYPSSRGQDACQIGTVAAMSSDDWLFPTYRDCMALVGRGINPVEVLTLLRGDWHCGYDPYLHRTAPQCTPLSTNTLHAVGLARAGQARGENFACVVFVGDGATSEGDTHEAFNFASVWQVPVVFVVQNNGYAISVPLSKQTHAHTLADKGIGYGMPGVAIDGNDAPMVFVAVQEALARARAGGGPTLIEALTYRMEPHTNADDDKRYRSRDEVASWAARDPIARMQKYLSGKGILTPAIDGRIRAEAEMKTERMRDVFATDPTPDPAEMFAHVYTSPRRSLDAQHAMLREELEAS